jgi:putative addiction module component (TIGR02574 family)
MTERVKVLCEEAAKLTPEEQADLVERINLMLASHDGQIEEAWNREAADRFAAYDRGEMRALTWEEVKKRRASR